jgi:hypothetical protein
MKIRRTYEATIQYVTPTSDIDLEELRPYGFTGNTEQEFYEWLDEYGYENLECDTADEGNDELSTRIGNIAGSNGWVILNDSSVDGCDSYLESL